MKIVYLLAVLSCLVLAGCRTSIREHHYFKDNAKELPNYYRVDITAHTWLFSKTRYWSGYFKTDAIDVYFNEFSQPDNGKLQDSSGGMQALAADPDRQLVVILSSNADDIANQIGNITQSKNALQHLLSLANVNNAERLTATTDEIDFQLHKNKVFVALGDALLNDLENKDSTIIHSALLQLMNHIVLENNVENKMLDSIGEARLRKVIKRK
ncbi:hypothetical protein [Leadbetterella sp. DM7]|uniref:hypothetical protein n=1 Tax=Leadbetterella sp. DM7 TaxID=3235085 RepID=UPI00349E5C44